MTTRCSASTAFSSRASIARWPTAPPRGSGAQTMALGNLTRSKIMGEFATTRFEPREVMLTLSGFRDQTRVGNVETYAV